MTTRLARLTPPGRSAIAVLSLRGPEAWSMLASSFRRRSDKALPEVPPTDAMYVGWLGRDKASDEVVIRVVDANEIEIHGHGGPEAVALIEETLIALGGTLVAWQEFEDNEPIWRREALDVLTQCPTARTAGIALDQWNGAFHRAVATLRELRQSCRDADADKIVTRLCELATVGKHLVRPWKVVLAGPPNVGKSSLINALAGFQRSVVSPIAGTTRDVVTSQVALDGWPILLADTAGLRTSDDTLEREGVARTRQSLSDADLVVWVVDLAAEATSLPEHGASQIVVANKSDLPPKQDLQRRWIPVSARTGEGIERLVAAIVNQLIPNPPAPGEAVPMAVEWLHLLTGM